MLAIGKGDAVCAACVLGAYSLLDKFSMTTHGQEINVYHLIFHVYGKCESLKLAFRLTCAKVPRMQGQ